MSSSSCEAKTGAEVKEEFRVAPLASKPSKLTFAKVIVVLSALRLTVAQLQGREEHREQERERWL